MHTIGRPAAGPAVRSEGAPTGPSALAALLVAQAGGLTPRRIAVVANAPVDASPARAARIDAADLVVRMTTFRTDEVGSAPPALGRRTDVVIVHRATRAGPSTFADYHRRLYLLAEPGRDHGEPAAQPPWWPADLAPIPIGNRAIVHGLRHALGLRPRQATWPTTGTLAVHLMSALFPTVEIDLAGSSLRADGGVLEHAWGHSALLTPEHRLTAERRYLDRLIAARRLRMLQ